MLVLVLVGLEPAEWIAANTEGVAVVAWTGSPVVAEAGFAAERTKESVEA